MHTATASSWDSFKGVLSKVLGEFRPETVFEWGPGQSTLIMQDFPSVRLIDTVEHNKAWWGKWKDKFGSKIRLYFEEDMSLYPLTKGRIQTYDLVFIDGREREQCLVEAQSRITPESILIIHDAERPDYKPFIEMYRFVFYEDDGHTCVMTNSDKINKRLEGIFENCHTSK